MTTFQRTTNREAYIRRPEQCDRCGSGVPVNVLETPTHILHLCNNCAQLVSQSEPTRLLATRDVIEEMRREEEPDCRAERHDWEPIGAAEYRCRRCGHARNMTK